MARVPETHLRYRTKNEIAEDIAKVLAADLSYAAKFAVFSDAVWVWTEFNGKHEGCEYWSDDAYALGPADKSLLRHEHIVPKKVLIDSLFSMGKPSSQAVFEFMSENCIGAVVTVQEDKLLNKGLQRSMPSGWHVGDDPWARYHAKDLYGKVSKRQW